MDGERGRACPAAVSHPAWGVAPSVSLSHLLGGVRRSGWPCGAAERV